MTGDHIREALLCWGQPKRQPSLLERIIARFHKKPEPPNLLDACVKVGTEITAKACVYLGREFRIPPDCPLPDDYYVIMAYCYIVNALISASLEDETAIEDIALMARTSRYLMARRQQDQYDAIVNAAWGLAQDTMNLRDGGAHDWQAMLAMAINGYIGGTDIMAVVAGGYPQLFGDLLAGLIDSQRGEPVS